MRERHLMTRWTSPSFQHPSMREDGPVATARARTERGSPRGGRVCDPPVVEKGAMLGMKASLASSSSMLKVRGAALHPNPARRRCPPRPVGPVRDRIRARACRGQPDRPEPARKGGKCSSNSSPVCGTRLLLRSARARGVLRPSAPPGGERHIHLRTQRDLWLVLRYRTLHRALIKRVIVRLARLSPDRQRWRDGIDIQARAGKQHRWA